MAFAAIIIALLVATIAIMATKQKAGVVHSASAPTSIPQGPWPFEGRRPLSAPQQELYHRLIDSLPGHVILPQVGLASFLAVKPGSDSAEWYRHVHHLSVDYLVCDQDMEIVAAVTLNDAPQAEDDGKAAILAAAGVKLIRWNTNALPELNSIAAALI